MMYVPNTTSLWNGLAMTITPLSSFSSFKNYLCSFMFFQKHSY